MSLLGFSLLSEVTNAMVTYAMQCAAPASSDPLTSGTPLRSLHLQSESMWTLIHLVRWRVVD